MARQFIESLEGRQFYSVATSNSLVLAPAALTQAVVSAPVAAPSAVAVATVAPSLGWAYSGKYKIGTISKAITVQFDRAYTGGLYAITVTDAWIWASNREPAWAWDALGVGIELRATVTGPISRNGLTGTTTLARKDAPIAQQDYNYIGSYTIDGVTKKISIRLVKGSRFGYMINVLDGGRTYDGYMYTSGGLTNINWFKYDANYTQIPVGTITGTFTADGTTLYGTVLKGTKTGTAILTIPGVAPAPQV